MQSKKFNTKSILLHLSLLIGSCLIIFLPWQVYIFHMYPLEANWEMNSYQKHLTEVLEGHDGPFYYYFDWLRISYGEIIYIPIIWFLWKTLIHKKNYSLLLFTIWFIVPYIFFSFAKTKTINYTLFASPAIFIIISVFCSMLYSFRKRIRYKWATYSILFLLIALPIRYTIERTRMFEKRDRNPKWAIELRELSNNLNSDSIVLFNVKRSIETMFYTNTIAYSEIPTKEMIEKIIEEGYLVYLNDNNQVDISLKNIEGSNIIKLSD